MSRTIKWLQRINTHFWATLAICLLILIAKCFIIYLIQHVEKSDASRYAESDSLRCGKGLTVDYISFCFINYSGIPRSEDY